MNKINKNFIGKIVSAGIVLLSRLKFFVPNFSPVGSFGFFGGNLALFAVTTVGFDLLWGGLYKGFFITYIGFFAYYFLGKMAKNSIKKQVVLLPVASILFFLISNFGVWLYWYPRSLTGLITCYTLALPFFKNTLLSDLVFGYSFVIARSMVKGWRKSSSKNVVYEKRDMFFKV